MTEKQKKGSWFKRHPILTGIIAVIIIGAIASSGASKNGGKPGFSSGEKNTETNKMYQIGEEVPTGKITYIVNKVDTKSIVGSNYTKKEASGIFKVVDITVRNESNEPITVDSNLFALVDSQGREFSSSTEGRTALTMQGEKDFFLTQAQPGLEIKGKLIFDVPKNATGLQLKVSGGFWSKDENIILLN